MNILKPLFIGVVLIVLAQFGHWRQKKNVVFALLFILQESKKRIFKNQYNQFLSYIIIFTVIEARSVNIC